MGLYDMLKEENSAGIVSQKLEWKFHPEHGFACFGNKNLQYGDHE